MADPLLDIINGAPPPVAASPGVDPLAALVGSAPSNGASLAPAAASQPGFFTLDRVKSDFVNAPRRFGDVLAGAVRGAGSIGATILAPYDMAQDYLAGKGLSLDANRQRRKDMDDALASFGADPNSGFYQAGKLGGEIAGTLPVGGLLAGAARAVLPAARVSAPVVDAISSGLDSWGFRVPGLSMPARLATRVGTGAVAGGTAAGLIDPEQAGTGAVFGAAIPAGAQVVGRGLEIAGNGIRSMRTPQEVRVAQHLGEQLGVTPSDLVGPATGPQMIPGYAPTVPQILQDPLASQLQRTLKTAGNTALGDAEGVQQVQFRSALDSVAPISASVQDAAERAGAAIQNFALPAERDAAKNVSREFEAVDPFDETRLNLPIEDMQKAADKYLGPGTFGTGSGARQAIDTATQVGTQLLPAIKPLPQSAGQMQSLEQAVRGLGGIQPGEFLSGEIDALRPKQSRTTGLYSRNGLNVEDMAQRMHDRGFIPDADPATLVAALQNRGGRKVFANDATESSMQRLAESAMGEAPQAERIPNAVPFRTVQNLRSSIGEAAERADANGANKEAAALRQMVGDIDARVNAAADGMGQASEYFPRAIANQYRAALDAHIAKMQQFETGPQVSMFRKGMDGQPSIQGAEIPGKFYNANRSQVDDMQSFKRLIGNRDDLMREMKSYAVTQGMGTADAAGNLTSKFMRWMQARTGANRELFNARELATLNEVGKAVERQLAAENLGRVSGPDTAQKLASLQSNGLIDSKAIDILGKRLPLVGHFTGPALDVLRRSATQTRQELMGGLLADPVRFSNALQRARGPVQLSVQPMGLLSRGVYPALADQNH
jgi:hypothetical protein